MVTANQDTDPATTSQKVRSSLTVNKDYLADKNRQAFNLYKLSQAIATEIITTLAEAGIAPKQELQALLTAAGLDFGTYQSGTAVQQVRVCHHCANKD
ncbi:hypothetical protein [Thalassomonas sp. RHCl1]|uniref:hypothetical protein n=1 Tax=Thalassomonas sp. RHCl1 TaxID=2995320 RepID=UPI00248D2773|nr:hypothetical protein [Thalassomonas sp. RHCl1]